MTTPEPKNIWTCDNYYASSVDKVIELLTKYDSERYSRSGTDCKQESVTKVFTTEYTCIVYVVYSLQTNTHTGLSSDVHEYRLHRYPLHE